VAHSGPRQLGRRRAGLFKKIDSTLRGDHSAELPAILRQLGTAALAPRR